MKKIERLEVLKLLDRKIVLIGFPYCYYVHPKILSGKTGRPVKCELSDNCYFCRKKIDIIEERWLIPIVDSRDLKLKILVNIEPELIKQFLDKLILDKTYEIVFYLNFSEIKCFQSYGKLLSFDEENNYIKSIDYQFLKKLTSAAKLERQYAAYISTQNYSIID